MKIIITESKLEKVKETISKKVMEDGIYDTAKMMGLSINDFIDKFGFELEEENISKMIDYYMETLFNDVFSIKKFKRSHCEKTGSVFSFMNLVIIVIEEFCIKNLKNIFSKKISDVEYNNFLDQIAHYIIKKYGDIIKNKFTEVCG